MRAPRGVKRLVRNLLQPGGGYLASRILRSDEFSRELKAGVFERANRWFAWNDLRGWSETRWGDEIHCDAQDFVQKHIYFFGEWEPRLTRYLERIEAPEGLFLDIGANVGYYSLLAARRFSRVIAFEPSPRAQRLLRANLARNGVTNVEVHEVAVGDSAGECVLVESASNNIGATRVVGESPERGGPRVALRPLLDFLDAESLPKVRFVKLDIEGAEPPVVRHLLPALESMSPDLEIAVEVTPSPDPEAQQAVVGMFQSLLDAGFRARRLAGAYDLADYLDRAASFELEPLTACPRIQTDVLFSRP